MRTLWTTILVGFLATLASGMGQRKEMERFIFLDPADTLQIDFNYSADPRLQMASPSIAGETERQRERDFREAIEPLLATIGLPMEYRILERLERPDQGHPVLTITAMRWRLNDLGEVEAVIRATLTSYGEKNVIGSFSNEESAFSRTTQDHLDRLYVETMIQSLSEMLPELLKHFEPPMAEEPPAE